VTYTHIRCGGTLKPEVHDKWILDRRPITGTMSHIPSIKGIEILHRCDRCNLIGVMA